MFDALGSFMLPVLRWLLEQTQSLGVAIILFTILTRILMLPLTIKQLKSQKKQMALQPLMRELQRKYGKDREKLTLETMKLYKEHGASPVGGCLPLFITLPILIGVWRAIELLVRSDIPASELAFLWIPDLTITNGDPYFILPVLSIALQFVVQQMAMPRNPDPQTAQMNRIMVWMPLIFGFFAFSVNSGAVLYMVTGSLIAMVQQFFTTGFGALPKYLPFLPERTGFLTPPPQPVAPDGEPYIDEPEPARHDFWAALEKLQAPLPGEVAVAAGSEGAPTVHSGKRVARPPKAKRPRGTSPGASTGDTTNADA